MGKLLLAVACFVVLVSVAEAATTPLPTQAPGQLTNGSPDLMPSDVKVNSSAIKPGQSVTVEWVMANKGDGRAAASVTGLRLRPAGRSDAARDVTLVREVATPAIDAGRSLRRQYLLTVPVDVPAGDYVFLVIADNSPASTLGQKDSSNDYASSSKVTITCQSSRPSDRPLVTEMQLIPDAGFVDPGYARTENREHLGSDFRAVGGACVYAVRDGKVVENTIANDPMRAVVTIEHADGSKAIYGHIESSVGFGTNVTRGTLLGTVRHPTANYPGFSSHLHMGEWTKPSDESIQEKKKFDEACVQTGRGTWGWGRAPLGTTREQILKCGWVDPATRYRTDVQASPAEPKVPLNSTTALPKRTEPPGRLVYETCFQMECFKQYLVTTRRNNDGLMLGRVATKPYWNDFYSGNQYKEDRAARNLLPISYHNYKVSCKIPDGYIESEEGGKRIPQPERYVSHATEGDFKIWKAVCDGLESGAISGETDAILRTVANSGLCPPSYGRTKIGKVIEKYATAICICTKEPDCDNATAYLKKVDNRWVLVDYGTGIFPENLIQYGFPKNIAYALTRP